MYNNLPYKIVTKKILLTIISLIIIWPMIFIAANSFMSNEEVDNNYRYTESRGNYLNMILIPEEVSLQQYYQILFRRPAYLMKFWNSVFLTVSVVVLQTAIAFPAAYAFAKIRFPGRDALFIIIVILLMLPIQVTLVPNYLVLRYIGLLDAYRGVIYVGTFAPLAICMLTQYLRYLPSDTLEAAKLDGAGEIRTMISIILPQAKGGIAAVAVLSFVDNWNMVEQPLMFLGNENMHPLSVYLGGLMKSDLSSVFAASVIFMIPAVVVFIISQEYITKGISIGGRL